MSTHKALARQWRPQSFNNFIGQPHAVKALKQSLKRQEIHHAHLFTGTRGVGKTSLARVFAKGLSCTKGITDNPCGQCDHCISIEKGTYIDLIEIDAASKTKVEDTKELLNQVTYPPVHGRFKIYIIDEVHSLSANSFNALLKTLEEPPQHVKFILATTDPQKLPITIQSRCLQLHLQHHQETHISDHLENILKSLNKNYDKFAIEQLAKAADGSLRDALSLLEQAIATSDDTLENDTICHMLGSAPTKDIISLIQAISSANNHEISKKLNDMEKNHHNHETIIDQMIAIFYQITQQQILPKTASNKNPSTITSMANEIHANQIQLYIQILIQGKKDIHLYPNQSMGFNLIIMRMMAFDLEEHSQSDLLQKENLMPTNSSHELNTHTETIKGMTKNHSSKASEILNNIHKTQKVGENQKPRNEQSTKKHIQSEHQNKSLSIPEDTQNEPTEKDWQRVIQSEQLSGMVKQVISQATIKTNPRESIWKIEVDKALSKILTPGLQNRIEQFCLQILHRKISISIDFIQKEKPKISKDQKTKNLDDSEIEAVLHDQALKKFTKDLNAQPITKLMEQIQNLVISSIDIKEPRVYNVITEHLKEV